MTETIMDRWHKEQDKVRKSKWNKTVSTISIGGLGDIKKKAIRFNYYSIDELDGESMVCPEFCVDDKPEASANYSITGQELLVSLCNLFEKINRPTDDRPYTLLITEWCKRHTHPYDIDGVLNEMEMIDDEQSFYRAQSRLEHYASFPLSQMIHDLTTISNALRMYVAITDLQLRNDGDAARRLYYEGKFEDGLPFFEKYRNQSMKLDDNILLSYVSLFPELKMSLQYQEDKKKIILAPEIHSIFDIAWYTLSCMSGMTAAMENCYTRLPIGRCECCNQLFVKANNRQKYCANDQCQSYRNQKKAKNYYYSKKSSDNDAK